jgi:hypothetical protein
MHVVTCGDGRCGTDNLGRADGSASFKEMIAVSVRQAESLGYSTTVFDLGGLGMGEPFAVDDPTFRARGYYREVTSFFKSKALHKPEVVRRALLRHEWVLYLDGDAVLARSVDDLPRDFDLAVTLRLPYEMDWGSLGHEITGAINAGVIFFRSSPRTEAFVARWSALAHKLGSDQWALNQLVGPPSLDVVGTVAVREGLRVRYLTSREYNFYHFLTENPSPATRIFHFKSGVRTAFRWLFSDIPSQRTSFTTR